MQNGYPEIPAPSYIQTVFLWLYIYLCVFLSFAGRTTKILISKAIR